MRFMKWYSYLICVILIVASCFTTTLFIRDVNHKSYVVGSSDFVLSLKKEGFSYEKSTLSFYRETTSEGGWYYFEAEGLSPTDFDSTKHEYEVVFNDVVIPSVFYEPGALCFSVTRTFYDVSGDELADGTIWVTILFYSTETYLIIETEPGAHVPYFEKYFSVAGLSIKVNELKEI